MLMPGIRNPAGKLVALKFAGPKSTTTVPGASRQALNVQIWVARNPAEKLLALNSVA